MADDKKVVKWRTTRKGHKVGINSTGVVVKGHPKVVGKNISDLGESTSELLERLEKIRSGEESMMRDFRAVEKELRRQLVGKPFGADTVRSLGVNFHMRDKQDPLGVVYTMEIDSPSGGEGMLHLAIKRKTTKEPFEISLMYGGGVKLLAPMFKGSAAKPGTVRPDRFEQDVLEYVKKIRTKLGKMTGKP